MKLCHAGMNYGGGQEVETSGEIAALAFVAKSIERSDPLVLFDVGANRGTYLRAALDTLGNHVRAYSFEPQSSSFLALEKEFADDPRVMTKMVALGKAATTATLYFGSEGETTASLHGIDTPREPKTETVQIMTLDQFCLEGAIERIDILKIDTEGHEIDVLLGAQSLMRNGRISSIQFEFGEIFNRTCYHFVDFFQLLSPQYRIYRILRHGLSELSSYSANLENYKTANFMCILKRPANQ
jgi:FkbM family methyltransferase